ncbi:MAG: diphthine--ammonia ligase [Zestosphaera sp.]
MKSGVALYTGGKDSHYALIEALRRGVQVDLLIIVIPAVTDSWMFHTVNISLSQLHADLMGLNKIVVQVSGVKEREVREIISSLRVLDLNMRYDYIVSGAVASKYQKDRVDLIAEELGLRHMPPLWGRDQESLLNEEVKSLSFVVTAIQAYGLNLRWLGSVINAVRVKDFLSDVRNASVSPVGEGGEFETFVVTSRLFRSGGLYINSAELVTYPQHGLGYYYIKKATTYSYSSS